MTDEAALFTEEEFFLAFSLVEDEKEARGSAAEMITPGETTHAGQMWVLAPDVLDLLSLVSEDCALRVQKILGIDDDLAAARRAAFRTRIEGRNE